MALMINTCCIDKTLLAELSEAINSMFCWYQKSKVCFAYLEDVSKRQLEKVISKTTGIDSDVLCDYRLLYTKSIARRMSWASGQETTRTEDIVYCLMGIFNVNMLLLYREGEKAFIRLQEVIMQSNYDHSLFV
ncbi:hypothetical protein B0J14DRAFT_621103 [Halenospora varia]|nr:hypothetical protein B0J14DRAFT_621103 [Halenospora varia]